MEEEKSDTTSSPPREIKPVGLDSVALLRLIEEVRNEPTGVDRSYDRVHNRHNR